MIAVILESEMIEQWDYKLQIDFENILVYFNNATREEWERFEEDNVRVPKS